MARHANGVCAEATSYMIKRRRAEADEPCVSVAGFCSGHVRFRRQISSRMVYSHKLAPYTLVAPSGGSTSPHLAPLYRERNVSAAPTTLWPSGLRRWTQVPLSPDAWVRIPQVSFNARGYASIAPWFRLMLRVWPRCKWDPWTSEGPKLDCISVDCRLQTAAVQSADRRPQTADCRVWTVDCGMQTADCRLERLQTGDWRLETGAPPEPRLGNVYCRMQIADRTPLPCPHALSPPSSAKSLKSMGSWVLVSLCGFQRL
jgi:hypothetical protein